ncbi:MAG: MBL fold metallo-hydrolase [Anaerolineaceae bacterium]|nr:MBL fold metallo-hydrolase [Anaerolineaceae bacterium]
MSLLIYTYVLGPLENNTYVVADSDSLEAAIIDPSFESESILRDIRNKGLKLSRIWLTHAHFDHFVGVGPINSNLAAPLPVGLHSGDFDLWRHGGGADAFGLRIQPLEEPIIHFYHGQILKLGTTQFEVRHTPGHTRGHVVFYIEEASLVLCGDLIFYHSIGRSDLAGGDQVTLLHSIQTQILTLPPETRLLSGHGPETSVAEESAENPFLDHLA